jgi:hypothetical protein
MTCPRIFQVGPTTLGVIWAALLVSAALAVFASFQFVRVIRTGRYRFYRDEAFDPIGWKAFAFVLFPTTIGWAGTALFGWMSYCGYIRGG